MNLLIIDDDELARLNLGHLLSSVITKGDQLFEAESAKQAQEILESKNVDLCFIDLDLERELAGLELIKVARKYQAYPIVLSGREESSVVEVAYANGCADFLSKPLFKDALNLVLQKFHFSRRYENLKELIFSHYITQDDYIVKQLKQIDEIILSGLPVLLRGPSGTGKTQMAKIIHEIVVGSKETFVHLNCAEIPENLVESELFGYVEGAFTGATKSKEGLLSLANNGTLFLDEIGAMPLKTQQKLLTAIEEKSFYPLGSEKPHYSNFRLISATCDDLEEKISSGEFRQDLFFRLAGHRIDLPSLKERRGDIALLVEYFLKSGPRRIVLNPEAYRVFEEYAWPGNVRELKFVVNMLQAKNTGIITAQDVKNILGLKSIEVQEEKGKFVVGYDLSPELINEVKERGLRSVLDELEYRLVQYFYEKNEQKVRATIKDLQISTNRFYRLMKLNDLHDPGRES